MPDNMNAKSVVTETPRAAEIEHSGFFVLRTPLLPFDELLQWTELPVARVEHAAFLSEDCWRSEVSVLREKLRTIVQRPEIVQALFVASPSLESSLKYWLTEPGSKKGLQAERSLVRYFARMCARSTPFGLFSGCSVGRIDSDSARAQCEPVLDSRENYRPTSRLDFDYLFALTTALRNDQALAQELVYRPNSSLRRIGDVWHYVESRVHGSRRTHHLVKLYSDNYLQAIIETARAGAKADELVQFLRTISEEPGNNISEEEAGVYIAELIQSEVLVPNLTPLVTGDSPLSNILAELSSLPSGRAIATLLQSVNERLAALDEKRLRSVPTDYRSIAEELKRLPAEVDVARLFQIDMTKPLRNGVLSESVISELTRAVNMLCRVGQQVPEAEEMVAFRDAFVSRYERAWVPLLDVLDEESGLGFGSSPIVANAPFFQNITLAERSSSDGMTAEFKRLLVRRIVGPLGNGTTEVVLEEADLPASPPVLNRFPDAFYLNVQLVASSMAALGRGDFHICVRSSGGPSGAVPLGRFCHADSQLCKYVRQHLRTEEERDADAVYAEIVHLPEGRVGNILCRPVLRQYEITYMGASGAPLDHQLPASDLLVTVTPGGEIVLFSQRLRRRVIPRLTSAHSYMNPRLPAVYRFLGCLQQQDGRGVPMFSWGSLDSLDTLPRLRIGRLVLAVARWRLSQQEVADLHRGDRYQSFLAAQELRIKRGLPRWIVYAQADNHLPVDLDNALSVDAFIHALKRTEEVMLQEMYPLPPDLCVSGPEGRFYHEVMVPFITRPVAAKQPRRLFSPPLQTAIDSRARTLPPGREWLYVKLYGGSSAGDDVLIGAAMPVLEQAAAAGLISKWFFVRYKDPQLHLRLRFQAASESFSADLLSLISNSCNALLDSGRIWKVQFDTYQREIERYGGMQGMLAAEDLFCADSDAVLHILSLLTDDESAGLRWRLALLGVDQLWSDFGFGLDRRREIARSMRESHQSGFRIPDEVKRQLGDSFRVERQNLERMLKPPFAGDEIITLARQRFARRSADVRKVVKRLNEISSAGDLVVGMNELAATYAHMHINRFIHTPAQPTYEMVIYDYLYRMYDSWLAREARGGSEPLVV